MTDTQLIDRSAPFLKALEGAAEDVMGRLGDEAAARARRGIRRKSGNLQASIQSEIRKSPGRIELWVGARIGGRFKGYHAHLVELGTIHAAPRPFLRPATRSLNKEFKGDLAAAVKQLERSFR